MTEHTWTVEPYDPDHEAPAGDPDHDCDGGGEEDDDGDSG